MAVKIRACKNPQRAQRGRFAAHFVLAASSWFVVIY